VLHLIRWCYTRIVPTTKPRYTFTDTGDLEALLDAAERRWPEISDRKVLLLRLAEEGGTALGLQTERVDEEERRERRQTALKRVRSLVDAELLLSDRAWR
jgi:histidinol phosphatase-like PHP family hydrolase